MFMLKEGDFDITAATCACR